MGVEPLQFPVLEEGTVGAQQIFWGTQGLMIMGLMDFISVGLVLLVAVGLCLAQWSGFQQGQDPLRFQQQQSPVLAPQQADRESLLSASLGPLRPAGINPWKLQEPGSSQSKQLMEAPLAPLTWHFPVVLEEPQQPDVPFELHVPTPAQSIAVQCGERSVHVEVKKDFFGTGQLVSPSFLTLGGCAAVGEDPGAQVLIFEYELQACGSSLMMTGNELVYKFTLLYTPEALVGTPIVRTDAAAVLIECHYSRLHNVSSSVLRPNWVPFAATKVAEEVLMFSLKLMTDDWMFERPSNKYYLGQFLNLEASVKQYNHVPLRIFVDGCVATAVPDVTAAPRYSFIENHGCLVDAKLTGSTSSFMHRVQNDKLHFRLESFRFQQTNSGLVYITCSLRSVMASNPISPENKACSFANGWLSADDNDQMCRCCDSTCGSSRKGRALSDSGLVSEGKATIGPIVVSDNLSV